MYESLKTNIFSNLYFLANISITVPSSTIGVGNPSPPSTSQAAQQYPLLAHAHTVTSLFPSMLQGFTIRLLALKYVASNKLSDGVSVSS